MEKLAELPLTGDQVGLFKAQPGRPKVPWVFVNLISSQPARDASRRGPREAAAGRDRGRKLARLRRGFAPASESAKFASCHRHRR